MDGFRSRFRGSCVSSHTEEFWLNETVFLWMTIYIYIYSNSLIECFIVPELLSVARKGRCIKVGSHPADFTLVWYPTSDLPSSQHEWRDSWVYFDWNTIGYFLCYSIRMISLSLFVRHCRYLCCYLNVVYFFRLFICILFHVIFRVACWWFGVVVSIRFFTIWSCLLFSCDFFLRMYVNLFEVEVFLNGPINLDEGHFLQDVDGVIGIDIF